MSFCYIAPAPPYIYSLSLHDALPIFPCVDAGASHRHREPFLKPGRSFSCLDHPADFGLLPSLILTIDRKSTRLNSSHVEISYAVFCLKKKMQNQITVKCTNEFLTKSK